MEEKKFDVVVVFGESAARAYREAWECEEPVSESKLEELGCVVRHSFDTEAERSAYLMALEDSDGWRDYFVAEEKLLNP